MADKNTVADWDGTTASNNDNLAGLSIAENNTAVSDFNNALRELMKQVKAGIGVSFQAYDADLDTPVSYASQTLTASQQAQARSNISSPLKGHIYGLTLSNNSTDATNDIDIAAGEAASTETSPVLMVLSTGITKQLDATWAVGTGNGGLDTGTVADGTYHVWLIRRSDTGVVDALFSTSASAPTMPTDYDQKRRIGSIVRASGAILAFSQTDDLFVWSASKEDVNVTDQGGTATLRALTVPTGISVKAIINTRVINAGGYIVLISSPGVGEASENPSSAAAPFGTHGGAAGVADVKRMEMWTNTSGQVSTDASSNSTTVQIATIGFYDTRGKAS